MGERGGIRSKLQASIHKGWVSVGVHPLTTNHDRESR
jgi:hypothetical protein